MPRRHTGHLSHFSRQRTHATVCPHGIMAAFASFCMQMAHCNESATRTSGVAACATAKGCFAFTGDRATAASAVLDEAPPSSLQGAHCRAMAAVDEEAPSNVAAMSVGEVAGLATPLEEAAAGVAARVVESLAAAVLAAPK